MRILALIAVTWSFVGMPTLCRAGILVECCEQGIPKQVQSRDARGKCLGDCPCSEGDEAPNDNDSSHPRDCDSCAESCNVVSTHAKQADGENFAALLVAAIVVTQAPCDALLTHQHCAHRPNVLQLNQNIPIPPSDRPLII